MAERGLMPISVSSATQKPPILVSPPFLQPDKPASALSGAVLPVRVLFVEDDEFFRNAMALELEERGFSVRPFADAFAFLPALDEADDTDIIILDWYLPKTSGIELLAAIRRRGINVPVVFLTGRNAIHHESQAFEEGAADFVDKTRGVEILVRRLKRAVEEHGACRDFIQGKLALHRRTSRGFWDGQDLDLTRGEYDILAFLAGNAGNYLSYRAIYDVLRAPGFASGHGPEGYRANLRSAIKRLRNKFRAIDPHFNEIESYVAFGYRWRTEPAGPPPEAA